MRIEDVPADIKQQIIREFLDKCQRDHEERQKNARPSYLRAALSLFPIQDLPPGALPVYDKDPDVAGYVSGVSEEE